MGLGAKTLPGVPSSRAQCCKALCREEAFPVSRVLKSIGGIR